MSVLPLSLGWLVDSVLPLPLELSLEDSVLLLLLLLYSDELEIVEPVFEDSLLLLVLLVVVSVVSPSGTVSFTTVVFGTLLTQLVPFQDEF